MLEYATLLIHAWKRTKLPDGAAWIRPITDGANRPLGYVRHQQVAGSWLFWLRKIRLDVFETEDASHLMSVTRSWTMLHIWDLNDAEDCHVGSVYPKSLITSEGESLGFLDVEQSRILDPSGRVLATFAKKNAASLEVAFLAETETNPFQRMLILAGILTLDAKPKN